MKRRPKIIIYRDSDGEQRWRLVGANGEVVLPPEGHTRKADVLRALRRAKVLMPLAQIQVED